MCRNCRVTYVCVLVITGFCVWAAFSLVVCFIVDAELKVVRVSISLTFAVERTVLFQRLSVFFVCFCFCFFIAGAKLQTYYDYKVGVFIHVMFGNESSSEEKEKKNDISEPFGE